MILLTFRDLVYRKTRFIVVTVLGAVVFALLFVMTGLVNQFNLEPADTVEQFGADEWVLPEGVSAPFTSVSVMPVAALDAVDAETKSPVVITRSSVSDGGTPEEVVLVGFEPDGLGAPQVVEGRAPEAKGEVALDQHARHRSRHRHHGVGRAVHGGRADREHHGARRYPLRLPQVAGGAGAGVHVDRRDQFGAGVRRARPAARRARLADIRRRGRPDARNRWKERSRRSTWCGRCCGSWRRSSSAPSCTCRRSIANATSPCSRRSAHRTRRCSAASPCRRC